jgi:hypothetical protein
MEAIKMSKKDTTKEAAVKEAPEGAVRIVVDKEKYVPGVSGSGKRTLNNGDPIASALNGMVLEEVEQLAQKLKVEYGDYTHLNVGMQRMNIGNRIRGAINKLEKAEEGTGFALLEAKAAPIRSRVEKRLSKAEKEATAKAKEKADAEAEEAAA